MFDGRLVTRQTEFKERLGPDDRSGTVAIERPIEPYNAEPVEQDDNASIAVEDLNVKMVECLNVESEAIKGTKLLPIALALAQGERQVHIAKTYGCDQSQISRAKLEIAARLRANGFGCLKN
jgi:hypothetical protein